MFHFLNSWQQKQNSDERHPIASCVVFPLLRFDFHKQKHNIVFMFVLCYCWPSSTASERSPEHVIKHINRDNDRPLTHLPSQGRSALTTCTAAAFLRTSADFINRSVLLAGGHIVAVTLCCPEKEHQHIKGIPAAYRGTATCSITRQLVTSPWGKREGNLL